MPKNQCLLITKKNHERTAQLTAELKGAYAFSNVFDAASAISHINSLHKHFSMFLFDSALFDELGEALTEELFSAAHARLLPIAIIVFDGDFFHMINIAGFLLPM